MESAFEIWMVILCQRKNYFIGIILVNLKFAAKIPLVIMILALMLPDKMMIMVYDF